MACSTIWARPRWLPTYSQLRLVLDPNTVVGGLANSVVPVGSTTEEPLFTPVPAERIKLVNQFYVHPDSVSICCWISMPASPS